ncbi:MAG: NAD(P)-dependent oxidoreductase [Chlamydiales bacterium]|nr:NAD(P)-dependent oxidoreductase [Chlamydiales bacterium]
MAQNREVILITGCSGRIGFNACARFAQEYQIVGFDVLLAGALPEVEFMMVDIASDESVAQGLNRVKEKYGNKIASVIHLAAYYNFEGGSYSNYERITVKGTERLLKGLQEFQVGQFIFSSTMLVHAPCKVGERITENSPVEPKWAYPRSKVETEAMISKECGAIPYVIMRIAGVYDDQCHSIPISNQIQRIYENQLESHLFPGDLTHGASFVHMDDLVEALWLAVQKRKTLPKELVLLIGEEETLSYETLQQEIGQQVHGQEWKTWRVPKAFAKLGAWSQQHIPFLPKTFIKPWMIDVADDNYTLDISRAKEFLGWQPRHSLRTTLPVMTAQLKDDPLTWYDENKLKVPSWLMRKSA